MLDHQETMAKWDLWALQDQPDPLDLQEKRVIRGIPDSRDKKDLKENMEKWVHQAHWVYLDLRVYLDHLETLERLGFVVSKEYPV